jgi:hypothetical protein
LTHRAIESVPLPATHGAMIACRDTIACAGSPHRKAGYRRRAIASRTRHLPHQNFQMIAVERCGSPDGFRLDCRTQLRRQRETMMQG